MTKHVFTPSETRLGVESSKAVRSLKKKYQYEKTIKKLGLKGITEEGVFKLLTAAVSSPVLAGVIAFGAVVAVEKLIPPPVNSGSSGQTQTSNAILQTIESFIPGFNTWNPIQGVLSGAQAITDLGLDFLALKTAIILYIASGGNLAGLLTSGGGLVSNLLKAAPTAAAVG